MKSVSEDVPHLASKRRRQEIEELLDGFGLTSRPRRLQHVSDTKASAASRARRLRMVLENLGPIFSAFGLYLSTRSDLLPPEDCRELGAISDSSTPLHPSSVSSFITQELGKAPQKIFLNFEEKAFQSRLLSQSHYGCLADGQSIVVRLVRPEVEEYFRCDAALLPMLRVVFAGEILSNAQFDAIVEDYHYTLRRQIDFLQQAGALQVLTHDAEEFGMLGVPVVHQSLCTSRLLTIERLPGSTMDEIILSLGRSSEIADTVRTRGHREELARRLCMVWLRQVFLGKFFPLEPTAANTTIMPNGQIAFTGGVFESLSPGSQANLFEYLVATATSDPDRAFSYLFRELMKEGQQAEKLDLMRRFRQVVPLRDDEWTGNDCNSLAAYVFAHWRLAYKSGYLPSPHLSSFYKGLFIVEHIARRLAPERDTLSEALQDVQLLLGLEKVRDQIDPRHLGEQLEKYGPILMSLPQRLDEVLTLAYEGRAGLNSAVRESAGKSRRRRNSSSVVVALLLVLAAFGMLSHRFAEASLGGWTDSFNAVVFVALSGLLLWAAGRG